MTLLTYLHRLTGLVSDTRRLSSSIQRSLDNAERDLDSNAMPD